MRCWRCVFLKAGGQNMPVNHHNLSFGFKLVHYFYFPERSVADEAARELQALEFAIEVRRGALGGDWLVRAKSSEARAEDFREQFESLAERLGGEYDGWERQVEN